MMKWARQGYTASCARLLRNSLRSIFFSECLNVIGESELTTSSESACIPNANAPTSKHVWQIVISRNGHNKFKMITSGEVRVNRKFENVFALNHGQISLRRISLHQISLCWIPLCQVSSWVALPGAWSSAVLQFWQFYFASCNSSGGETEVYNYYIYNSYIHSQNPAKT